MTKYSRGALICLLIALMPLVGCATPPARMTLFPGDGEAAGTQTWPALPERPRYRYGGQLLGEENFESAPRESSGARLLQWILGVNLGRQREASLWRPQSGMVENDGRILVTDVGRQAVVVFDAQTGFAFWDRADGGARFINPVGITAGANAEIHVADAELGRVVRLDRNGDPLGSFGADTLRRPTGLVRDTEAGLTYVADTAAHDIKVFDDAYRLVRTLGERGAAAGHFNAPTFLALLDGQLIVSDTLNARVQVISPLGVPQQVIGARGLYVGNLTRPKGVAVDGEGNIYVVESFYDHLLVFDREGRFLLPIGGNGSEPGKFFLPGGVWSDTSNRIFVADVFNSRVSIFQYLGE